MSRRRKALFLFLGLGLVLGLMAANLIAEARRGEDIFWLAELFVPAAVLSIGLVTGLEFLMPVKSTPLVTKPAKAKKKPRNK